MHKGVVQAFSSLVQTSDSCTLSLEFIPNTGSPKIFPLSSFCAQNLGWWIDFLLNLGRKLRKKSTSTWKKLIGTNYITFPIISDVFLLWQFKKMSQTVFKLCPQIKVKMTKNDLLKLLFKKSQVMKYHVSQLLLLAFIEFVYRYHNLGVLKKRQKECAIVMISLNESRYGVQAWYSDSRCFKNAVAKQ